MRIFNVGWIVFTMMIAVLGYTIYGALSHRTSILETLKVSGGVFAFLGIGYIGAVIGNAIRLCLNRSIRTAGSVDIRTVN